MTPGEIMGELVSAELRKHLAAQQEEKYWKLLEALPLNEAERDELVRLHLLLMDAVWESWRTLDPSETRTMDEMRRGMERRTELWERQQILMEKVNVLCGGGKAPKNDESVPPCFLL
jgi:hypothetical protein